MIDYISECVNTLNSSKDCESNILHLEKSYLNSHISKEEAKNKIKFLLKLRGIRIKEECEYDKWFKENVLKIFHKNY